MSSQAETALLPDAVVHFVQRHARTMFERRRYERLRKTTTIVQAAVRGQRVRREYAAQKRLRNVETAAHVIQTRFRSRPGARKLGCKSSRSDRGDVCVARAAFVIQAHVRRHLEHQHQQLEVQKEAVSKISDRVKLWLQVRVVYL